MSKLRQPKINFHIIAIALFLIMAAVSTMPIFTSKGWGVADWDQFLFYAEAGRKSIVEFHQMPLWSPYFCGGNILLANPQSQHLSPSFLLTIIFGAMAGMKIRVALFAFIGLLGMYVFARGQKLSNAACVLAAVVFQLSGTCVAYTAAGQQWIQPLAFLPWALFCLDRARCGRQWVAPAAVFIAAIWLEGGIYPFPFALLLMLLFSVLFAEPGRPFALIGSFVAATGLAFLLGAAKFLPFIDAFSGSARILPLESEDVISAHTLFNMFLSASPRSFSAHYPWFENFGYIGWLPAALAAVSVTQLGKTWKWWALLLVSLLLILGVYSPVPLWPALHGLPFFSSMHVTARFRLVAILPIAIICAVALDRVSRLLGKRKLRGRILTAMVVAVSAVILISVNYRLFSQAFVLQPRPVPKSDVFVQHWRLPDYGASWSMYPAALAGEGTVTCYEFFTISHIPFGGRLSKFGMADPVEKPEYRGEAYLAGKSGAARYVYWSPNRLVVRTESSAPDRLVINQNYDRNWSVSVDAGPGRAASQSGAILLSAPVPSGPHTVEFTYVSRQFQIGFAVSAFALIACMILIIRPPMDGGSRI